MYSPSRVWAAAASVVLAGALAACSGDDDGADTTEPPSSSPSVSVSESATVEAATVATAQSDLGTILVDGAGMTLYLFTNDTPGSGESTCEGQCLAAWPPVLGQIEAGAGVDAGLAGTITRTDGATQATYNGWPLYYWASDAAPGDVTGQGVNDVWWVVSPEGEPIGAP